MAALAMEISMSKARFCCIVCSLKPSDKYFYLAVRIFTSLGDLGCKRMPSVLTVFWHYGAHDESPVLLHQTSPTTRSGKRSVSSGLGSRAAMTVTPPFAGMRAVVL